jgi:PBP1b-binding outer membrane lipoprotein LpoB
MPVNPHPVPYMQRLIALLLLATFLVGCASIEERKKSVALETATRQYQYAIRWGDYEVANACRLQTGAQTLDPESLKRFRVTSYDTLNTALNEDESKATITVQIKYYDDERMTVETLTDRQVWEYDSELERWFLDGPLPAFH